jgi:hypothetical protein
MTLTFTALERGGVGIASDTAPFDPTSTPTNVGLTWVGVCMVVNDYLRSIGVKDFDCMRPRPLKGS